MVSSIFDRAWLDQNPADNDQRSNSHTSFQNGQEIRRGVVVHCLDSKVVNDKQLLVKQGIA